MHACNVGSTRQHTALVVLPNEPQRMPPHSKVNLPRSLPPRVRARVRMCASKCTSACISACISAHGGECAGASVSACVSAYLMAKLGSNSSRPKGPCVFARSCIHACDTGRCARAYVRACMCARTCVSLFVCVCVGRDGALSTEPNEGLLRQPVVTRL